MMCKNCQMEMQHKSLMCSKCGSHLHKECAINDGGVFCDLCYMTKGDEKVTKDYVIPEVIRRTYIETYRACPYRFYKEVIEGHTPPPTSYTQIGIDLHEHFEEACYGRIEKDAVHADMKKKFEEYSDDLFQSGFASDNREDLWKRSVDCVDTFFEKVLPSLPHVPFTTEQTIEFDVGQDLPRVQFTMDRIDEVDGELELHDWKTGKVMVGQKLSSDLQAPLYIYGTKKHFNKPVRSFTFYYLQENKIRIFTRTAENPDVYECKVNKRSYYVNLTDTIREIQHVFSQIKNGNFSPPRDTKKMHFTCKMCPYYQTMCEGADVQGWKEVTGGGYSWT